MNVGERIKQKRIELNMSQDELAKKVGYRSRSSIQKIEASRDLPLRKVSKMARALGCTESYLMGWLDEPTPITLSGHSSGEVIKCTPIVEKTSEMKIIELIENRPREEQAEILDLLTKLLAIPHDERYRLLDAIKEILSLASVRRPPKDTTE